MLNTLHRQRRVPTTRGYSSQKCQCIGWESINSTCVPILGKKKYRSTMVLWKDHKIREREGTKFYWVVATYQPCIGHFTHTISLKTSIPWGEKVIYSHFYRWEVELRKLRAIQGHSSRNGRNHDSKSTKPIPFHKG